MKNKIAQIEKLLDNYKFKLSCLNDSGDGACTCREKGIMDGEIDTLNYVIKDLEKILNDGEEINE